jgi:hypothetical protein
MDPDFGVGRHAFDRTAITAGELGDF